MNDPQTPTKLIDQLRAWFFAKDRSVYLAPNTFIDAPEIATPGTPATNRHRLYPGSDNYWYELRDDGSEAAINFGHVISVFMDIPGLVGFWPMSSVQRSTGNAYDVSGQSRTLTYNGNPTYNIYNSVVPYIDLDGTGDYLSRTDETDLDIIGTETIYASAIRGLTMGGWFWENSFAVGNTGLMSKWGVTGASGAYMLYALNGNPTMIIESAGGGTSQAVGNGLGATAGKWLFVVGRYTPASEVKIYINNQSKTTATAIASLRNNAISFEIGNWSTSGLALAGRAALCFLSANVLPDSLISILYQQSRLLFGV